MWDSCPDYLSEFLEEIQLWAERNFSGPISYTMNALLYKEKEQIKH